MVKIISFLKLLLGATEDVIKNLKDIPEVHEIYYITGEYDLLVLVESPSGEDLHELFAKKIEKIKGIELSYSHLVMKHWEQNQIG